MIIALAAVVGYLLGALPFAVWIARSRSVNIFEVGSGNPGATNVRRTLGAKLGNLCFALDATKGLLAAAWPLFLLGQVAADTIVYAQLAGLLAGVLGHSFSVFIGFRGGKGVAVTIGGMLAILPGSILIGLVLWLITWKLSRVVAIASIVLGLSLPLSAWLLNEPLPKLLLALLVAVIIVVRHRSNIQQLLGKKDK